MAIPSTNLTLVEPPDDLLQPDPGDSLDTKPKTKFRSAWISFASRILAQLIGAAATIGLGVVVMQHYAAPAGIPSGNARSGANTEPRAAAGIAVAGIPLEPVLVVLPFANVSAERRHDALADALTEALIAELTQGPGWRVISRTTSMRYKQSSESLPAIARELNAGYVIEGSVAVDGTRMRAVAQLIDAATDHHVWARSYDRPMGNLLDVEAEIVSAVARDLRQLLAR